MLKPEKGNLQPVPPHSPFVQRHIGISDADEASMLKKIGVSSRTELIEKTVPESILKTDSLELPEGSSESEALAEINSLADQNQIASSFIGQGYYGCITPPVIQRLILENPGWYTAYTPYQAEISQGRLEMLLNFQQMVCDLTAMPVANASLLDEGTAAAEAMSMAKRAQRKNKSNCFYVDQNCHPQTISVVKTRARYFGYQVEIGDPNGELPECFAVLLQYPGSTGELIDPSNAIAKAHERGALAIVATDLLALTMIKPPGEMGADIVVGSSQRLGVPMGFGGPHAAFFAFQDSFKRSAPGRIIGVSEDTRGRPALRMAMQTREQHIRREKATSNICTSQVLLAVIAAAYAVYHGPDGLKAIATSIHDLCSRFAKSLESAGVQIENATAFDTLKIETGSKTSTLVKKAIDRGINLRVLDDSRVCLSFDETHGESDLKALCDLFDVPEVDSPVDSLLSEDLLRTSPFLQHEVFHRFRSETEFMRYLQRLQSKDLALDQAMIPLGSCTMKLNAAAEMTPITWPNFSQIHPFAPEEQSRGYRQMIEQMEQMLCACTGYDAVSLQPNAGSQGEYAGLLAIAAYHQSRGENRHICLIPESAHGTNPASAQMAGMQVIVVGCDEDGNVDIEDLKLKAEQHSDKLAAAMLTYPSTHGVFETAIQEICGIIHDNGGQVYIDGANLNAMVGLAEPGKFGGDVSHLNLHKTFCIPHGGGGPGVGPIGVKQHLAEFLPADPSTNTDKDCVSSANWGSASILPISWMYIRMMGAEGLKAASEIAILNANFIARRLEDAYPVLYRGEHGYVAHECIIDIRPIKAISGISEEDIAKRLVDYGFHAPTMSFPVPGTLMIEPTESESLAEIERFCEAMLSIRAEIAKVESGEWPLSDNPLTNAPHTLDDLTDTDWSHCYSREQAVKPSAYQSQHKYWPAVNRIDNVLGDRNLICTCPPLSDYL